MARLVHNLFSITTQHGDVMPESPAAKTMDDFPIQIEQPVQWGEQDGFGHINNMHFIRWFESARIAYLLACDVGMTTEGVGPILAAVSCNFRKQIKYPDTVIVGARVASIGRSSMKIEHALQSSTAGEISADGDSTVVMFNYQTQQSAPISDELRAKICELEGRQL